MKIFVKVKTKARKQKVEKIDEEHFKIFVKSLPIDGKANKEIAEVLSDYFNFPKSQIKIIIGETSNQKIIEITEI